LVVEEATGLPAPGFAAVSRDNIHREQERVWKFDWYAILPPAIEELTDRTPSAEPAYEENEDEATALRIMVTVAAVVAVIAGVFLYSHIYDLVRHWR
jgi:hypothetical protein